MPEVEGLARHRSLVAEFFGGPFELPELPESLPTGVPPWKETLDAD